MRQRILQVVMIWGLAVTLSAGAPSSLRAEPQAAPPVPILVYHRFGPAATDTMTTPTTVFAEQLRLLRDRGWTVVPLRQLLDRLQGRGAPLPERAVVITVDDGHRSVYTELFPVVRRHRLPVTLFIYPSAISNASYALTWDQLRELRDSGLFDIQSHTYWHPNFRREKQRLGRADYEALVTMQLVKSRQKLEHELGTTVDLLAWPFGIYDRELMHRAAAAGYVAAFTIEPRPVTGSEELMALPRFLLTDATQVRGVEAILNRSGRR